MKKTNTPPPPPLVPVPALDAHWKIAIELMPEHFAWRFFPDLAPRLDFKKGVRSRDKEMQKLLPGWEKKGWTAGDKLLEFHVKASRKKQLVLVHVDVHGDHKPRIKQQMFTRGYRILDANPGKHFTAICIYIGKKTPAEPNLYRLEFDGTKWLYEFNACIVRDLDEQALLASDNPFDLALLAMRCLIKTGKNFDLLEDYKTMLGKLCLQKGWPMKIARIILNFVSFAIALPPEKDARYNQTVDKLMEQAMQTRPLIETQPQTTQFMTKVFFGKTLAEMQQEWSQKFEAKIQKREAKIQQREAKIQQQRIQRSVFRFHLLGIAPASIAQAMEMKQEDVEKIIEDFTKANPKAAAASPKAKKGKVKKAASEKRKKSG